MPVSLWACVCVCLCVCQVFSLCVILGCFVGVCVCVCVCECSLCLFVSSSLLCQCVCVHVFTVWWRWVLCVCKHISVCVCVCVCVCLCSDFLLLQTTERKRSVSNSLRSPDDLHPVGWFYFPLPRRRWFGVLGSAMRRDDWLWWQPIRGSEKGAGHWLCPVSTLRES